MIIGIWRGGASIAIAVQEYFAYLGIEIRHDSIKAASYVGIDEQHSTVRVNGTRCVADSICAGDQILLVDDVFDTGRTALAVKDALHQALEMDVSSTIQIACPWYKPDRREVDLRPDFYLYETSQWLVFPHELLGLNEGELKSKHDHNQSATL